MRKIWIRIICFFDLRKACWMVYGDHFVELYDTLNMGFPIGNMQETKAFLDLVERVKKGQF